MVHAPTRTSATTQIVDSKDRHEGEDTILTNTLSPGMTKSSGMSGRCKQRELSNSEEDEQQHLKLESMKSGGDNHLY